MRHTLSKSSPKVALKIEILFTVEAVILELTNNISVQQVSHCQIFMVFEVCLQFCNVETSIVVDGYEYISIMTERPSE